MTNTRFFYKQHFFSTQCQSCLNFSWIELQMLLRCCLIPVNIIIMRHILYLVYMRPFLGLFMSYLWDLFFIFSLNFIVINYITSFKQKYLFLCTFLWFFWYYFWMITWMKRVNNFKIAKVQPQLLIKVFIFSIISYYFWMITWMKKVNSFKIVKVQPQLLLKELLIKKACI